MSAVFPGKDYPALPEAFLFGTVGAGFLGRDTKDKKEGGFQPPEDFKVEIERPAQGSPKHSFSHAEAIPPSLQTQAQLIGYRQPKNRTIGKKCFLIWTYGIAAKECPDHAPHNNLAQVV